ncbi:alginate lyase family protein [Methylocaldum szegediense]|uniref:Heparinase II/III-like protein n=1 Tax=Methylocaldum szegediense TaxID=73780 RepID=A0ABN8X046_9GAMM|nr:alginate lyase family protein [Methylocaldum szegediense]CAI8789545.1 Heparinase II/III-like protein [Methylocaldum szegediense]
MSVTAYDKVRWYVKRLSVMSGAELGHRLKEWRRVRNMARAYRRGISHSLPLQPAEVGFCRSPTRLLPDLDWVFDPDETAKEALLAGHWPALGFAWCWNGDAAWHRAPDTGKMWPKIFFGNIAYRQGNPYGDARVVWEPARLQQLVSLALLALRDEARAERALVLLETMLDSWVRANPPLTGIHYVSAMECALRLIAVCHALDLVRHRLRAPESTWRDLLKLVFSHAFLIAQRPSLHSSAGNHTVAEAVGLVYAGILFPEHADAARWLAQGLGILQEEAERQVLPDGGGIEQSFWYQLFVVDLLGLAQALLEHHRRSVPRVLSDAVRRGRRFLSAMADGPESLPRVGDSDDGYALSPHLRISWNGPAPAENPAVFPDAGYTLVRTHGRKPVRLVFDHGPLGMPPACGHGHADALSLHVTVCGRELLIDPNTYTYTGDPAWRHWFRSTAAHNTVRVDGRDQARQETAFQWSHAPKASLVTFRRDDSGRIFLLARHDGYRSRDVIHWRAVAFDGSDHLLVLDYLAGQGHHLAELFWHLGVDAEPVEAGFVLRDGDMVGSLEVAGGAVTLHYGETAPMLGWRSPRYGVRVPANAIRVRYADRFPHQFRTAFSFSSAEREAITALEAFLDRELACYPIFRTNRKYLRW